MRSAESATIAIGRSAADRSASDDLQAAAVGELHVEDHDVGRRLRHRRQGVGAGADGAHPVPDRREHVADGLAVDRVVLDQQHRPPDVRPPRLTTVAPPGARSSRGGSGSRERRRLNQKRLPTPSSLLTSMWLPCSSTMCRQMASPSPTPGTSELPAAGKGREDPLHLRCRDPPPRVADGEADGVHRGVDLQPHPSSRAGELDRVGEEVDEDLAEPDRVGEDPGQSRRGRPLDGHLSGTGERRDHPGHLVEHGGQVDGLEADVETPRLQASEVEKVVDQGEEVAGHGVDAASQGAKLILVEVAEGPVGEQLRRDHDPADRSPQLVGEAAQEMAGGLHLAAQGAGGGRDPVDQLGRRRVGAEPRGASELRGHPGHEALIEAGELRRPASCWRHRRAR